MEKRCCFLIGHRETTDALYPALYDAVVRHMVVYDVGEFVVGQYGGFDRLAARVLHDVKGRFPGIRLTLLLAYHRQSAAPRSRTGLTVRFIRPGWKRRRAGSPSCAQTPIWRPMRTV